MVNKTDGALRDKFDVVHDLNDKLDSLLNRSDIDQEIIKMGSYNLQPTQLLYTTSSLLSF